MNVTPGEVLKLKIIRVVVEVEEEGDERGCWLDANGGEIKLDMDDFQTNMKEGEELEVFIYIDENVKVTATVNIPDFKLHDVGCSRVVNAGKIGAYVSIGTVRDIIIPLEEQKRELEKGDKVVFVVKYDYKKSRLYGTTQFTRVFKNNRIDLQIGDQVDGIVVEKLPFGRRLIIDNRWIAIIFRNDILRPMRLGDHLKFYVREIKEQEKEIVVSMQKLGLASLIEAKDKILDLLEQHNGYMRLHNDTEPEEIKLRLRISKNTFKRAAGELSDEGEIVLTKRGMKLKKK